jgi:SAM-dependent methyltransferase
MLRSRLQTTAERAADAARDLLALPHERRIGIADAEAAEGTGVDRYWNQHTVNSTPFRSARESEEYLEWRFQQYPLFRELLDLWGDHAGDVVLDYGCGPGNDVTGFLLYSGAERVIGVDVSRKALELARRRLALHRIPPERVELIRKTDADARIPLPDRSVDFVQCLGVLHHTSDPGAILRELRRVLKPGGTARFMVYNYDSLWLHLYTAYVRMVRDGDFAGLSVREAFARNTDGEECPIAHAWTPEDFGPMCAAAGFDWTYLGGYLSLHELDLLARYRDEALESPELDEHHKEFLRELTFDDQGLPLYRGLHAGIGGSYLATPA